MLIAGVLLGLIAIGRFITGFVTLAWPLTGNAAPQPVLVLFLAVVTLAASTAYLVWLAVRGRHALRDSPLSDSTPNILVGYGVLALVVLPVVEFAFSR